MYYLEYHELLKKYREADKEFNNALDKNGELLKLVSLKATKYQEILINHTNTSSDNKLLSYLSEIDEIRRLIDESRNVRNRIDHELREMELKMRNGKDVYDKIYVYKWIDKESPYRFSKKLGYTTRQVYRYINEIKKEIYPKS